MQGCFSGHFIEVTEEVDSFEIFRLTSAFDVVERSSETGTAFCMLLENYFCMLTEDAKVGEIRDVRIYDTLCSIQYMLFIPNVLNLRIIVCVSYYLRIVEATYMYDYFEYASGCRSIAISR